MDVLGEKRLSPVAVSLCMTGILLLFSVMALNGMVD
jgi:hypothetical protein